MIKDSDILPVRNTNTGFTMKFSVSKESLSAGLQKVLSVISSRSPIPVLSNVLVAARKDTLYLTATDLELSVRVSIAANVSREGETTLPAKFTASVVREAPADEVQVSLGANETTEIVSGAAYFSVRGISAEDFLSMPSAEGGQALTLDQKLLKTMLLRTGYAASGDESRPILNGVLLRFKEGRLSAVATDGRRLALVEQDVEVDGHVALDLVIPSKAIMELVRSLGDEGKVGIRATASQVIFETEDLTVYSKLLDGEYPNYAQVIPRAADHRMVLERELFMNAVRRVALMTSAKSNSVKLTFRKNQVEIAASSVDIGEARETVPVKYDGTEMSVTFNPVLLAEPLRYLVSDEIFLEISSPTSPGVIKTDEPFLYVIMPMMIS